MRPLAILLVPLLTTTSCASDSAVEDLPASEARSPTTDDPAAPVPEPDRVEEPPPEPPAFVYGASPGEGLPHFYVRDSLLEVHESPSSTARVIERLELDPGTEILQDSVRFQTLTPWRFVSVATHSIDARRLGAVEGLSRSEYLDRDPSQNGTVAIAPGDTIDYVLGLGEGECLFRVAGEVWDHGFCPMLHAEGFEEVSRPSYEWWIRAVDGAEPLGWVLVDDSTFTVRRTF